ncbi:XdhC family protein [Pseudokineococcus sp. 1T1Z-3]|uniref:XdhC family protein n=1 Tax=Pseudokineococcus sp. 1T1Z-3 TaxID=3132745 RepID=UPI00309B63A2
MLEVAGRLLPLLAQGPLVLATVLRTEGTSWPPPATSLALSAGGEVVGGLSAGCVESAALERCEQVLRALTGAAPAPPVAAGGRAWHPLGCDAAVEVLVHVVDGAAARAELAAAAAGRRAGLAVLLAPEAASPGALVPTLAGGLVATGEGAAAAGQVEPGALRSAWGADLADVRDHLGGRTAPGLLDLPRPAAAGAQGEPETRSGVGASLPVLLDTCDAAPLFVVVGAGDLGAAVAAGAVGLGYRVVVLDHRARFAVGARVPAASDVVLALAHEWLARAPLDERSVVCVLSHDDDLDPLAVAAALRGGAGVVGALGSRATHARRLERLAVLGVPAEDAARVRGPVGLDLGARTTAEQALAVLAEVVAARRGGDGRPLRDGRGAVHRR